MPRHGKFKSKFKMKVYAFPELNPKRFYFYLPKDLMDKGKDFKGEFYYSKEDEKITLITNLLLETVDEDENKTR